MIISKGRAFTVFPDGRAIIKGTNDLDKAREHVHDDPLTIYPITAYEVPPPGS